VQTPEQLIYEIGRSALSDQESLVAGIRQRTGTLLAADALIASFLGSATLRAQSSSPLTWIALATLVAGLIVAVVLLAPWPLRFALDTRAIYEALRGPAVADVAELLVTVGLAHQKLRSTNDEAVRRMSRLSGALAALTVWQTLAWTGALVVG
jgi:hypothetical protein